MKAYIDRFEGEYAILELDNNQFIEIPKILVSGACEGDVVKIEVCKEETKERKENIRNLSDKLFVD